MHIQESGEMYLETILILSKKRAVVRAIDVGEYMDYSKPSVSRAMRLLKEAGAITVAPDGAIHLTVQGKEIAEKIYARHNLLTQLLIRLGVDAQTASADACKMEHVISDKTFDALQKFAQTK
jgi:Mn-dependent DtxR family transcriptional regulator